MKKILDWIKNPKSDFVFGIIFLVLLSLVASRAFFRIDLTSSKSYSISSASRRLVKTLSEPLSVHVFFSNDLPSPYNATAQYVKDILTEYSGAANKNFHCQFYDMKVAENEILASQFGLRKVQIQEVSNNEVGFKQAWMGIAFSYNDAIQTIDGLTETSGLELRLSATMSKMISTANALAGLAKDENLVLELFSNNELEGFNISGFKEMSNLVQEAFRNVNAAHQNRIVFRHTEPNATEIDELVARYGIQKLEWQNKDGTTGAGTIGLVLSHKDNFRVIPLSMQRSLFGYMISGLDDLENAIRGSIESLVSRVTEIGYITGHDELNLYDQNQSGASSLPALVEDTYSFVEINLAEQNIPANISSLMINGPKTEFSEEELYKLDQFIMRGGNVMFFVDPFSEVQIQYYQMATYTPIKTGLEKLLEKYGVTVNTNYVMDTESYPVQQEGFGKMFLYWAPVIQRKQLAAKNPITNNLGYVIFLQAASLDITDYLSEEAKSTVLVRSSNKSWTVSENIQLNPMFVSPITDKEKLKAENLAVMFEGKFNSAYDKAPEANEATGKNAQNIASSSHIAKSVQHAKIFVAGTSFITSPQLIGNGTSSEPIAMFLRNAIDYMNGNEELCSMRTKGLSLATLDRNTSAFALAAQYFNEFGIAVLVALAGLLVWHLRSKRRRQIAMRYNPNDSRTISTETPKQKTKKETKTEEKND